MKTANNLCADIGYLSINHTGEQLCGELSLRTAIQP